MTLFQLGRASVSLTLLAVCSCASQIAVRNPEPTADSARELRVVLDASLRDLGAKQGAWQFYAVLKSKIFEQRPSYREDYWIEVGSRDALATYWNEQRKKNGAEGRIL